MARHLRVEFPGAIYHVHCRMVGDWKTGRTYLFKDDADQERFLERLAERVEQFPIPLRTNSKCEMMPNLDSQGLTPNAAKG